MGGIVIAIVCIYIFFAFIGDFGKDRRQKELLDTIKSTKSSEGNQERFPCPSCAEMVLVQANVCRYCGRDLPEDVKPVKPEIIAPPATAFTTKVWQFATGGMGIATLLLIALLSIAAMITLVYWD